MICDSLGCCPFLPLEIIVIVVTGASGFIGSNLVHELGRLGHGRLVLVDRLHSDGRWKNLVGAHFLDFIFPEMLPDFLRANESEIEAVIHLGANSSTTSVDGDAMLQSNLHPSMDLWRWAAKARKLLIYASSASTYGDGEAGFDDRLGGDVLARLVPLNLYGWSKQAFDIWALDRAQEGEAPPYWAGLKFFNVYGPREDHKGDMMSVVSKNLRQIREGRPVNLFKSYKDGFADGEQLRDFVYVGDCVKVILWLMKTLPTIADGARNGLYNVGTGKARSFRDLILAAGEAFGRTAEINFIEMPVSIRGKYQYFTEARVDKLREAGYEAPFLPIEYGVRHLAEDV
jgi:ADP-L-glycero-D-manno-heptose 6-epimerase